MLMTTSQGPHLTVARDGIFIMLSPSTSASELDADLGFSLWQELAQPNPLPRALAMLLAGGIAGAPEFVMARRTEDGLHVIVRANASVHTLDSFGNRKVITGQAANTWVETTLDGDLEFAITLSSQPPGLCGIEPCLLASGVARTGALVSSGWVPTQLESDLLINPGRQTAAQTAPEAAPELVPELASELAQGAESVPAQSVVAPAPPTSPTPVAPVALAAPEIVDHTILTNNLVAVRAQMATGVVPVVPAPVPVIVMHTGERVSLNQPVLIGRAPSASRVSGQELPRLIAVTSPNNDISRTHVQVRFEGDLIMVTDLNSTNGVILSEPQHGPRRLHPDEPTPVPIQGVVDLGDGVFFRVEAGL